MKNNISQVFKFSFIVFGLCILTSSCKYDNLEKRSDNELFALAKSTSGFVWYKSNDQFLPRSSSSGHSQPFLKTRYNTIAAKNLDSTNKVSQNTNFDEGSIIVKELYDSNSKLELYAILYKKSNHLSADKNGWVWGYINADGSVRIPSIKKGESCVGCHSQSGNIDYMLMNKYYP